MRHAALALLGSLVGYSHIPLPAWTLSKGLTYLHSLNMFHSSMLPNSSMWATTVQKEIRRFRILIVGRANAGKTTILQRVCNTTALPKIIAPNGDTVFFFVHQQTLFKIFPSLDRLSHAQSVRPGALPIFLNLPFTPQPDSQRQQRGEHDIENEMVFKSNPGFVFHDSRGFEAGGSSEFQVVKNFIANRAEQSTLSEKLHAIWYIKYYSISDSLAQRQWPRYVSVFRYCIPTNDATRPITRAELDFFEECGTEAGKQQCNFRWRNNAFDCFFIVVPVIVLFTKADSMDSRTTKQLIKAGYTDEAAERKAPQQAIKNFQEQFCGILYQKKYPPTSHLFFRGIDI